MSDFAARRRAVRPDGASAAAVPRKVVVIGDTDIAGRVCGALRDLGDRVVHMDAPSDADLHRELATGVTSVAVLVDDDIAALRYALAVEHVRPRVPLLAAIFDRTVAQQLVQAVPNCRVMSPADLALPALTGACLDPSLLAVASGPDGDVGVHAAGEGTRTEPFALSAMARIRGALGRFVGQLRPHDGNTGILLAGLAGLLTVLLTDTVLSVAQLHLSPVDAFFHAVRTVATVGPAEPHAAPSSYKLLAAAMMLATIVFTAVFTAGIVNRLLEPRLVGLLGSRTLPRAGHVVVVGLGQVGLRLCEELRRLRVPVVAVERNGASRNVRLARALRIPVVVGDAGDRFVLDRLALRKARALAAVSSDDLENVAVAVTARAVSPATRVVMRAGDHDAIAETRSLFAVGQVCDVNALSAAYFTLSLHDCPPAYVFGRHHDVVAVAADGSCHPVPGHGRPAADGGGRHVPRPRDTAPRLPTP